jgi:mevalonate kinase
MQLKASAPGSLMLLGEYAVLYGKHALVSALDKRMTVTLTPREDDQVHIHSERLGSHHTDLNQLTVQKPFQFVLAVLKHYRPLLKQGCDIDIQSDFSDRVGLGSSAAVTVATSAALITWLNVRTSPLDLVRHGRNIVRHVQGVGSGADIAASVYGGLVGYQAQPLSVERFPVMHPITAMYAGFKTATAEAIKQVQDRFVDQQPLFRHISNAIGQCALEGMQAVRKTDWPKLGMMMNIQQGLLESLGVGMPVLRELIDQLRGQSAILGAKISGSGLGDCVIGLGQYQPLPDTIMGTENIPVAMSLQGVHCEKI